MPYTETALYCDSVAWNAVTPWAATTAYTVGQRRRQLATPTVGNERCFVCYGAGTSAGSEPAWSAATKGQLFTADGTVKWIECTALPAVNGDVVGTNAWGASKGVVALGATIKNIAATHYFICTTTGTGGTGAEPSWNTTVGGTTTDGSVIWTCLGAISSFTTRWAAPAARLLHLLNSNTTWLANAGMTVFVGDDHAESASSGSQSFV